MHPNKNNAIDELCVNTLRTLSIDAVQKANSGHPGLPLGAAPMAYVLWQYHLKHNPRNPYWYDRDRFVLSAGHGSMLLYSLLHLTGYDLPMEQLQQFRQWSSHTPGHPERDPDRGIDITTGPLGQGFANGVGMAMAEAYLAAHFNQPGFNLIDHYTYGIVSDGDLMEGVASEAASIAGHLKLGKLIYLYDNNHMTLSSTTSTSYTEDCQQRFEAYGWHTDVVTDGNNLEAIHQAIEKSKLITDKPSLILIRTIIGFGSPHKQNTFEVHGSPLGEEEVKLTKQQLGWDAKEPFYIPPKAHEQFQKAIKQGADAEQAWDHRLRAYQKAHPAHYASLMALMNNNRPDDWFSNVPSFPTDVKGLATRDASEAVMQAFSPELLGFIGGSADLNASTKTALINLGNFQSPASVPSDLQGTVTGGWNYAGRNIFYGIREHAMGAISNGIATFNGLIPFTATFLTFSDYMRPAIRLAALMRLHVIFVFTHDSIALGEDGPTHQPVEHLAALRAIPQLIVIRPADANETAISWKVAIETQAHPIALILTRQKVPTLDRTQLTSATELYRGAYTLLDASDGKPDIILIASGSEVSLILEVAKKLSANAIKTRVVSMPSWELFEQQPQSYRDSVLLPSVKKRLSVEAGVSQGWEKYVGDQGVIISINEFGASAPGETVMQHYGFNVDNIYNHAYALIEKE